MSTNRLKTLIATAYKKECFLFLGLIICLVGIEIIHNQDFDRSLRRQFNVTELTQAVSGSPSLENTLGHSDPQVSVANYILTDSVLSAVQNYHVESPRVTIDLLYEKLLKTLNSLPEVRADHKADTFYLVKKGNMGITFDLGEHKQYSNLLTTFLRSSFYLKKNALSSLPPKVQKQIADGNYQQPISFVLDEVLAKLDPHSSMLSKEVYKELRDGTEGSFGGLGVLVGIRDNMLSIMKVLPNGPAEKAGMQVGDKIIHIGSENTYGRGIDSLIDHMRGPPGSKVQLTTLNTSDLAPRSYELTRESIDVSSVEASVVPIHVNKTASSSSLLRGSALVLKIDSFSARTSEEVENAILKAQQKQGKSLAGIVLDLRSNPGGLLDQAVKTADLFITKGVLVSTDGRLKDIDYATNRKKFLGYPVTVLLNQDSASASEILAGALQDHNRGIVIGQPSFGKGSVQTIFELPNSTALKLTIARYYTPNGHSIQNSGIVPDIWIQNLNVGSDNINLFGSSRYQGENHLANHLKKPQQDLKAQSYLEKFKIFQLYDYKDDYIDSEVEVSKIIFSEFEKYSKRERDSDESFDRASFWYSLALPELKKYNALYTENAFNYLSSNHDINWQGKSNVQDLDLVVRTDELKKVYTGDEVYIPWRIKNNSEFTAARVSIYINPLLSGLPSQEILVGSIGAGVTKNGSFKLKIRAPSDHEFYSFMAGYTIDAVPVRKKEQRKTFAIRNAPKVSLDISYDIKDESRRVDGYLQPSEKASLVVKIKNDSGRILKDLNYRIVNLSGKQLRLNDKNKLIPIPAIGAQQVHTVAIPMEAGDRILEGGLRLGISIDGVGLSSAKHQLCTLKTTRSREYLSSIESSSVAH